MVDGALAVIDLDQDFAIEQVWNYMTVIRREKLESGGYVPVVNRGCMWQDSLNNIYLSGGHFFSQAWGGIWSYWDLSKFFVPKEDIPDYSVWRHDTEKNQWAQLSPEIDSKYPPLTRLVSSGYTSIPSANMSYAFGYVLQ